MTKVPPRINNTQQHYKTPLYGLGFIAANSSGADVQTKLSMDDRPPRVAAEPVVHTQMLPTRSIERSIGQLVRLLILLPWNAPEASSNSHQREVVAQAINLAEESLVLEMVTIRVEVPILTPGGDPRSHTVDQVSRVRFDDDLRNIALVHEMTANEHFGESAQGVDGGAELGALAGWTVAVHFEGFVVVRVDVEEDAAGCNGVGAAVVATGAVGGDDDCVAMGGEFLAVLTCVAIVAGYQID